MCNSFIHRVFSVILNQIKKFKLVCYLFFLLFFAFEQLLTSNCTCRYVSSSKLKIEIKHFISFFDSAFKKAWSKRTWMSGKNGSIKKCRSRAWKNITEKRKRRGQRLLFSLSINPSRSFGLCEAFSSPGIDIFPPWKRSAQK